MPQRRRNAPPDVYLLLTSGLSITLEFRADSRTLRLNF